MKTMQIVMNSDINQTDSSDNQTKLNKYYALNGQLIGKITCRGIARNDITHLGYSRLRLEIETSSGELVFVQHHDGCEVELTDESYWIETKKPIPIEKLNLVGIGYDRLVINPVSGDCWSCTRHNMDDITKQIHKSYPGITLQILLAVKTSNDKIICMIDDDVESQIVEFYPNESKFINKTAYQQALSNIAVAHLKYYIPGIESFLSVQDGDKIVFQNRNVRVINTKECIGSIHIDDKVKSMCSKLHDYGILSFPNWVYRLSQEHIDLCKTIISRVGLKYEYNSRSGQWTDSGKPCPNPYLPVILAYHGVGASTSDILNSIGSTENIKSDERKINI